MYAVPLRRRSTQRCPGAIAGERGGAAADLHSMRGAQLGCVYWLLCAIYLYAALGSVVASGGSGAVQLVKLEQLTEEQVADYVRDLEKPYNPEDAK